MTCSRHRVLRARNTCYDPAAPSAQRALLTRLVAQLRLDAPPMTDDGTGEEHVTVTDASERSRVLAALAALTGRDGIYAAQHRPAAADAAMGAALHRALAATQATASATGSAGITSSPPHKSSGPSNTKSTGTSAKDETRSAATAQLARRLALPPPPPAGALAAWTAALETWFATAPTAERLVVLNRLFAHTSATVLRAVAALLLDTPREDPAEMHRGDTASSSGQRSSGDSSGHSAALRNSTDTSAPLEGHYHHGHSASPPRPHAPSSTLRFDIVGRLPLPLAKYVLASLPPRDLRAAAAVSCAWRQAVTELSQDRHLRREADDLVLGTRLKGREVALCAAVALPHPLRPEGAVARVERHVFIASYTTRVLRDPNRADMPRVAVLGPGNRLLSAGSDRVLRLWDPTTGRVRRELPGHAGTVRCVALCPQRRLVLSGSYDTSVRLWHETTGQCVAILRGHTTTVMCAAVCQRKLVALTGDKHGRACLWDLSPSPSTSAAPQDASSGVPATATATAAANVLGACLGDVRLSNALLCVASGGAVAGAPAPGLFVVGTEGGDVVVLAASGSSARRRQRKRSERHNSPRNSSSGSSSGGVTTSAASSAASRTSAYMLVVLATQRAHMGSVTAVDIDGDYIFSGGADRAACLWPYRRVSSTRKQPSAVEVTDRPSLTLAHACKVTAVRLCGARAVTGGDDGRARIWHLVTGECLRVLRVGAADAPVWSLHLGTDNDPTAAADATAAALPPDTLLANAAGTLQLVQFPEAHAAETESSPAGVGVDTLPAAVTAVAPAQSPSAQTAERKLVAGIATSGAGGVDVPETRNGPSAVRSPSNALIRRSSQISPGSDAARNGGRRRTVLGPVSPPRMDEGGAHANGHARATTPVHLNYGRSGRSSAPDMSSDTTFFPTSPLPVKPAATSPTSAIQPAARGPRVSQSRRASDVGLRGMHAMQTTASDPNPLPSPDSRRSSLTTAGGGGSRSSSSERRRPSLLSIPTLRTSSPAINDSCQEHPNFGRRFSGEWRTAEAMQRRRSLVEAVVGARGGTTGTSPSTSTGRGSKGEIAPWVVARRGSNLSASWSGGQ